MDLKARRCPSLRKIDVSKCPDISGRAVSKFVSISNKLTDFVSSQCDQAIDHNVSIHIIENLRKSLVKLDLSYCKLNDIEVIRNVARCLNLRYLTLSGCPVNDDLIEEFTKV